MLLKSRKINKSFTTPKYSHKKTENYEFIKNYQIYDSRKTLFSNINIDLQNSQDTMAMSLPKMLDTKAINDEKYLTFPPVEWKNLRNLKSPHEKSKECRMKQHKLNKIEIGKKYKKLENTTINSSFFNFIKYMLKILIIRFSFLFCISKKCCNIYDISDIEILKGNNKRN